MYGRNSYLGQGFCTHGVKEEDCKVCAWIIENCNACSRCQARVVTVEVETGFSGEFESLCGPCISEERLKESDDEIGDRDVGFKPLRSQPAAARKNANLGGRPKKVQPMTREKQEEIIRKAAKERF